MAILVKVCSIKIHRSQPAINRTLEEIVVKVLSSREEVGRRSLLKTKTLMIRKRVQRCLIQNSKILMRWRYNMEEHFEGDGHMHNLSYFRFQWEEKTCIKLPLWSLPKMKMCRMMTLRWGKFGWNVLKMLPNLRAPGYYINIWRGWRMINIWNLKLYALGHLWQWQ